MLRTVLGFGGGMILTFSSLGFAGVGHGTYVPMAFSGSLLILIAAFGPIIPLLVPFWWAGYFHFIPRLSKRLVRMWAAILALVMHLAIGSGLALSDPAFARSPDTNGGQLLAFFVILAFTMILLGYFAWQGTTPTKA